MSVRLVITMTAVPGKSDELAALIRERNVVTEPGCEQFEIFRNVRNPDQLVVLERWKDQESLDTHLAHNKLRPPVPLGLRLEKDREDYQYHLTNRAEYALS
jgi:quinol monooxygenase YgiN